MRVAKVQTYNVSLADRKLDLWERPAGLQVTVIAFLLRKIFLTGCPPLEIAELTTRA